ncbi:hypothetical protein DFH07DRAFT_573378 [Mycena maculata]|uniref:Uncharacterized protein n=1 Tax=Mycena maculata TaxID=230809 RepID=A0AAD7ISA6_9AGAR|nr:hypothetical protein DFH07DRAFT_573378 [Mycena maculata]
MARRHIPMRNIPSPRRRLRRRASIRSPFFFPYAQKDALFTKLLTLSTEQTNAWYDGFATHGGSVLEDYLLMTMPYPTHGTAAAQFMERYLRNGIATNRELLSLLEPVPVYTRSAALVRLGFPLLRGVSKARVVYQTGYLRYGGEIRCRLTWGDYL